MFALKQLSKLIFSNNSKESIIEIPQGQLYLVRPQSPKGFSELIFKDSAASIRRTAQPFQYQLVIQRAYEEGEAELLEEDGESNDPDGANFNPDKDERTFLLDESLRFRAEQQHGTGDVVFAWSDLSGDAGDLYEFVCAPSVKPETAASFSLVAAQCQFERKYRLPQDKATEAQLQEFTFNDEEPIPQASPVASPTRSPRLTPTTSHTRTFESPELTPLASAEPTPVAARTSTSARKPRQSLRSYEQQATVAPAAVQTTLTEVAVLTTEPAELHLFDFQSGTFILQNSAVTARASDVGKWSYYLRVSSSTKDWLAIEITPDLNPVFNFEYLSFIFNQQASDGQMYSWLLRFKDSEIIDRFQHGLSQALWEHNNQTKWHKVAQTDRDYILNAMNDLVLEEDPREEEARLEDEELAALQEDYDAVDEEETRHARFGRASHEQQDESDDDDDEVAQPDDGNVNSLLAVGAKHDRSFVVRGSKIGVFKHTPDNHLEFSTNISKVQTPGGKLFSPKKVMLHEGDRNMILHNESDPHSLYRMDLEYGKVVDEWKIHDDIPVTSFAPTSKFAQLTDEQTFVGLSDKAVFRVDPRLAGQKMDTSQLKQYAASTKTGFTAATTTEKGHIALASATGEIRLYDRLGINAKTAIPGLGDPITGLDVSADGRWVLATTRTYLLLIDAMQPGGAKNGGKLGFEKSFAKDAKPNGRKMGLKPEHVCQFQHECGGKRLDLKPARFNAGTDTEESTIVTALGPWVITWNLRKFLEGRRDAYSIKRYDQEIKADDFRFGSDKNIVVALPNEVGMVAKRALRRPTRESILATPKRGSGSGSRTSKLRRSDVVNSPY